MAEYQFNPTYNELIIKFRDGVSLLQLEQLALEHEKIIQYANLKLPKGRLLMSLFDAKNFSFFKHKCTFLFSIAKQELSFFNEISSKSLKCADELGSLYAVIKYKKNYDLFNDFIEQIGKNRAYSNQGTTKLYYLKIRHKNKNYYKIGITNRSVKERYKPSEAKKIESILFENFINDAEILENCLLVHYAEFRTNNPEVFLDGYTEVFDRDILNMDKWMIIDEKIQIAMNINTTIKELYELVEDKNTKVIQAILYRPFLPLDFLMKISEHKSVSIRAILAQHPKTPKVILEKLFQSLEHKVLASLAKNHNTPEEYLIKLSKYESKIINNAISTNPNAPVGILKELNVFSDSKIIKSFLKNQDLSSALVTAILEYSDFNDKDIVKQKNISVSQLDRFININQSLNVLETIASHPNADAYILDKIIETQKKGNFYSSSIETAIAKNKNTNIKTLNKLFKDEYYHDSLAENPNFSSRLLRKLVFPNQDEDILQAIARNPSINRKLIDALFHVKEEVSGEEYDFINIALADNKNTPPYILDTFIEDFNKNGWLVDEEMNKNSYLLKKLSKHADNYVRLSVACNYATPEEVLNTLCNDNDSTIRSVAFMNLYFKCSINENNITHQIN